VLETELTELTELPSSRFSVPDVPSLDCSLEGNIVRGDVRAHERMFA
jgi:hypothetical protein